MFGIPYPALPRMRRHFDDFQRRMESEVLANFGGPQIAKHLDRELEILGVTQQNKAQAHAWMKQFLTAHRVALRETVRTHGRDPAEVGPP